MTDRREPLKLFVEPPDDVAPANVEQDAAPAHQPPPSESRQRKSRTRRVSPEEIDREIEQINRYHGHFTIARPADDDA
jgi:hypothetical protein